MKRLIKYIPLLGMLLVLIFINDDEIIPTIDNPFDYFASMFFQIISIGTILIYSTLS